LTAKKQHINFNNGINQGLCPLFYTSYKAYELYKPKQQKKITATALWEVNQNLEL